MLYNKVVTDKRLLMNAQNLLPGKIMEQIYYAHVYSHLTYGLVSGEACCQKETKIELARYKLTVYILLIKGMHSWATKLFVPPFCHLMI